MQRHTESATDPRKTIRLSLVSNEPSAKDPQLDAVKARRLASLEAARGSLVQTMLDALAACQRTGNRSAQLLLSAAVRDLDDMDRMLHELRHDIENCFLGRDRRFTSRVTPTERFPDNLRELSDDELHILNSKVHRQMDAEYLQGGPQLETQIRKEELSEELNWRETSALRKWRQRPSF